MFEEKDIESYQAIKAPKELKEKVLSECQYRTQNKVSHTNFYKSITAVAVCFVMIVTSCFIWAKTSSVNVYFNDSKFSGSKISVCSNDLNTVSQRNIDESNNGIELNAKLRTDISISNGMFHVWDIEKGELLFSGKNYSVKGKVLIQFDLIEGESAILSISNDFFDKKIKVSSKNLPE